MSHSSSLFVSSFSLLEEGQHVSPVQVECTASYLFHQFLQNYKPHIGNQTYTKQQVQQLTVARTNNTADTKSHPKKTFEKIPALRCNATDIN